MISPGLRVAIVVVLICPLFRGERLTARSQGQRPRPVSLSPADVKPGDVMRIDVPGVANRPITATLFGANLHFWFDDRNGVWTALAGVDLEKPPGTYRLRIRQNDAPQSVQVVRVFPKRFTVRRLRVAESFVNPPSEVLERIASDGMLLAEAYAQVTPRRWQGAFRLPVDSKPTSNFGVRSYYNGQRRSPHAGIDFMSDPGTAVMATNYGTVALAAPLYFTGNTVVIDHGAQLFSVYAHLSAFGVKAGDAVTPQSVLGFVGATGRVTGPHLHWSVRLNGARVDPLSLMTATQTP